MGGEAAAPAGREACGRQVGARRRERRLRGEAAAATALPAARGWLPGRKEGKTRQARRGFPGKKKVGWVGGAAGAAAGVPLLFFFGFASRSLAHGSPEAERFALLQALNYCFLLSFSLLELQGGTTMEEQRLVVIKEEERTENGRDPFIVQVRTIGDSLTGAGPSHIKMESQEEIHQRWDFQWQEFLKRVAALPAALPPLDDDARGFPVPWGRIKENPPPEESSGEARGESMLQRDPNISGKAWMDREKLDFCMKVKVEESLEEVDLGSQWPLQLRQFGPQDAEQHQEVSNPQRPKKGEEWGIPIPALYDTNISQIGGRGLGDCDECDGYGTTHKKKTFQVGRSEEIDFGRFH
ncbi:hypothetical protein E2320_014487 [Naja naja]|nr:hypothetical protein E2320_014487 [Naja naja]